jgi:hypothetical protein
VGSMLYAPKQRCSFYKVLSPDIRIIKFSRWNSTLNVNEKFSNKITIFLKREINVLHYKISSSSKDSHYISQQLI